VFRRDDEPVHARRRNELRLVGSIVRGRLIRRTYAEGKKPSKLPVWGLGGHVGLRRVAEIVTVGRRTGRERNDDTTEQHDALRTTFNRCGLRRFAQRAAISVCGQSIFLRFSISISISIITVRARVIFTRALHSATRERNER